MTRRIPTDAQAFRRAAATPLPLGATPGTLVSKAYRGGRAYSVFCAHHSASSEDATVRSLRRKLAQSHALDELDDTAARLNGRDLIEWTTGAFTGLNTQVETREEGPDIRHASACLRYRLVVTHGRAAVGYVTVSMSASFGHELHSRAAFAIDVGDVWIQPAHRRIGVGKLLADAVSTLVMHALLTLDERLPVRLGRLIPVRLIVGADLESSSGDRFINQVADAILDEDEIVLETLNFIRVTGVLVDPRW